MNTQKCSTKTYQLAPAKRFSVINKVARAIWNVVWFLFFLPTPRPFHAWRCFLLKLFGAKIGKPAYVYPTARIWAPWNLVLGQHSTISEHVNCYCVDKVYIGDFTTISQHSFLCSASHDYLDPSILEGPLMPLITAPILIGNRVWITADVFIAPGVCINDGAVVLARSSVFSDVPAWRVVRGNPAVDFGPRLLRSKLNIKRK